jgi:hypothetical protein
MCQWFKYTEVLHLLKWFKFAGLTHCVNFRMKIITFLLIFCDCMYAYIFCLNDPMDTYCVSVTDFYIKFLYYMYHASCHKLNINQEMRQIDNMYKVYLRLQHMFQWTSCHLQGGHSKGIQKLHNHLYVEIITH